MCSQREAAGSVSSALIADSVPHGRDPIKKLSHDLHSDIRLANLSSLAAIRRHRHIRPYATIVLSGGYEEAGDRGRFRVSAGDVLIHPPFAAHCDRIWRGDAKVLDIALPMDGREWPRRGKVADADLLIRIAERDGAAAQDALLSSLSPAEEACSDLPDLLADNLDKAHPTPIARWASGNGLARETLTRQFTQLYEIAPSRYRVEARARRAWRMIVREASLPLADIAAACGYADQAQLTREVRLLTGFTPGAWRRSASPSHLFNN